MHPLYRSYFSWFIVVFLSPVLISDAIWTSAVIVLVGCLMITISNNLSVWGGGRPDLFLCFLFRMIQSASSQADPSEIRKLYGVEFAVFSDDPHRCHMWVIFDDISLLTFAERHDSPNCCQPGPVIHFLEMPVWRNGMLQVPGRTFTELMFGFDTLIIIWIGEESRRNANASSSWPVFRPAKRTRDVPGSWRSVYILDLDFDNACHLHRFLFWLNTVCPFITWQSLE